jgi:hypothetical protein
MTSPRAKITLAITFGMLGLAFALGITGLALLAAAAAAVSTVALTATLILDAKDIEPPTDPGLLEKVEQRVESGRKLVIFERETGLFAHWYVTLRGQEECARARRYERELMLTVIEPAEAANAWALKDELASWLGRHVRSCDIAGYLGNARYIVLMPETDPGGAEGAIARLRQDSAGVTIATSRFPEDGASYDELYATATSRLAAPNQRAA